MTPGRYLEKGRRPQPGPHGKKSAFATVFEDGMDGAGGGGRRYCGESVGAMVCIFGVGGRVCVVAVGRIDASD